MHNTVYVYIYMYMSASTCLGAGVKGRQSSLEETGGGGQITFTALAELGEVSIEGMLVIGCSC